MNLEVYSGENDIFKYLHFTVGERFILVKDGLIGFIGLYDKVYLYGSIMTNSKYEKTDNLKIIEEARGDVLLAGLGIGLIVLPIMNKPEVNKLHIVELNKEVIDIVGKQLPLNEKVTIFNEDIYKFEPKQKYDTIYFDVCPYVKEGIPERFRKDYLNEGGCIAEYIPSEEVV